MLHRRQLNADFAFLKCSFSEEDHNPHLCRHHHSYRRANYYEFHPWYITFLCRILMCLLLWEFGVLLFHNTKMSNSPRKSVSWRSSTYFFITYVDQSAHPFFSVFICRCFHDRCYRKQYPLRRCVLCLFFAFLSWDLNVMYWSSRCASRRLAPGVVVVRTTNEPATAPGTFGLLHCRPRNRFLASSLFRSDNTCPHFKDCPKTNVRHKTNIGNLLVFLCSHTAF